MRGIQLRQSESGPELLGTLTGQVPTWNQDTELWEVSSGVLDQCVAVQGFTSSDIAQALESDVDTVCFPPGQYQVDAPLTQTRAGQVLSFENGAVLVFSKNGLGQLLLTGAAAQIVGFPTARWEEASSAAYVAIDLQATSSACERMTFELNADVPNCTLLRLSGDNSRLGETLFSGTGGSFRYGVDLQRVNGTSVSGATSGRMTWLMADDGIHTRTFSALLRINATRSQCGPLRVIPSGRHRFNNAIVEVLGQHNSLLDPQIFSGNTAAGVWMRDDAEFFAIYDGEITGNYLAGSVGILCGDGTDEVNPATGQLKCYDTKILNWDIGVKFTGSSDTPEFFGATIANNKTAQVQIDSHRTVGDWPVSGLSFFGVYSECVAFACPFLHLKSGALAAGIATGCYWGIVDTAIVVDAGMGANTWELSGNRFAMSSPTDAVVTPNANSNYYFGQNGFTGSNLISKGANATKAMSCFDPVLTGLVIGTRGTLTANNHFTSIITDIYTGNFGNVSAGATVALAFSYPGVPTITTASLDWSIDTVLGAKAQAGIIFQFYINAAGQIVGTATNITGSTINAVNGGIRFVVSIFG